MPIDTTGKRLSAAEKLRSKGYLVSVRQAVYTGDVRTGQADHLVWAVLEDVGPAKVPGGDRVEGLDIRFTMSALTWIGGNTVGEWGPVLQLQKGDMIQHDGSWVPVVDPGAVAPNNEPVLYEPYATSRKQVVVIPRKEEG